MRFDEARRAGIVARVEAAVAIVRNAENPPARGRACRLAERNARLRVLEECEVITITVGGQDSRAKLLVAMAASLLARKRSRRAECIHQSRFQRPVGRQVGDMRPVPTPTPRRATSCRGSRPELRSGPSTRIGLSRGGSIPNAEPARRSWREVRESHDGRRSRPPRILPGFVSISPEETCWSPRVIPEMISCAPQGCRTVRACLRLLPAVLLMMKKVPPPVSIAQPLAPPPGLAADVDLENS